MSHVHEAHGIEKICHTVYVNSALTDNRYKVMKQVTIILFMLLGMMFSACSSDSSKGDSKYSNLSTEKLMKKAQENDLEAITQLGMNAAYKKNYEEAEKWLRKAAEQD